MMRVSKCVCVSFNVEFIRRIQFNFSDMRFIIGRRNIWTFYVHKFPVNFVPFHKQKHKIWAKDIHVCMYMHTYLHKHKDDNDGHRWSCFANVEQAHIWARPKWLQITFCTGFVSFLLQFIVVLVAVVQHGHCSLSFTLPHTHFHLQLSNTLWLLIAMPQDEHCVASNSNQQQYNITT